MNKKVMWTSISIASILLIALLILSYLGFVPILSDMFGANDPIDLGIQPTEEDYSSANEKLGRTRGELIRENPYESIEFLGSHPVNESFSSEEATITTQKRNYKYNPVSDTQIRFNDDGTVESSGKIIIKNVLPSSKSIGISKGYTDIFDSYLKVFLTNPAYYTKGTVEVTNGSIDANLEALQIGKLNIPASTVSGEALSDFGADVIDDIDGLEINSLSIENGELHFDGTYPDETLYVVE